MIWKQPAAPSAKIVRLVPKFKNIRDMSLWINWRIAEDEKKRADEKKEGDPLLLGNAFPQK